MKKIICVDDSKTIRYIVENTLKDFSDIELCLFSNGLEAFTYIEDTKDKIDLIITDFNMPKLSGVELVKEIKRRDKYENIPIIVLTSSEERKDIRVIMELGVQSYIIKPFKPVKFKEKVLYYLEKFPMKEKNIEKSKSISLEEINNIIVNVRKKYILEKEEELYFEQKKAIDEYIGKLINCLNK